jgi:hypothetical protein
MQVLFFSTVPAPHVTLGSSLPQPGMEPRAARPPSNRESLKDRDLREFMAIN